VDHSQYFCTIRNRLKSDFCVVVIAVVSLLLCVPCAGGQTNSPGSGQCPSLTVFVAYVILPGSVTPFPVGAPNFIGSSEVMANGAYDTGAIWIVNNGPTPVTISTVTALGLSLWRSFTIPAGGSEFLAATAVGNFDGSDFGGFGPDDVIITIGGQNFVFHDPNRVLEDGGSDRDFVLGAAAFIPWTTTLPTGANTCGCQVSISNGSICVPGTADIFLAGQAPGACVVSPFFGFPVEDCVPDQGPVNAGLTLVPGTALQFVVSGATNNSGSSTSASTTPDGGNAQGVQLFGGSFGLSGINTVFNALVGVFLGDGPPDPSGQPPSLNFIPPTETSFQALSPQLQQVFFIGDGLTGTGTGATQAFVVPEGATRLFLGSSDGLGTNSNNQGSFQVLAQKACQVADKLRIGQCDGKIPGPDGLGANGFPAPHWGGESYGYHTDREGTICHWGCALTALSMCLTHSGITQIPNFSSTISSPNPVIQDPGFLNSLMTRKTFLADYDLVGSTFDTETDNNVNFDVTTRDVSNLLNLGHPLRFDNRFSPASSAPSLEMALCHPGQGDKDTPTPVIVKVRSQCSGQPLHHFVLVTGKIGERFKIADPAGKGFDANGNPIEGFCTNGNSVVTGQFLDGPPYNGAFQIVGSVTDPSGDVSGLDFVVGDSVNLLVTDSNGRRAGFNPSTDSILKEIPGASYSEEAIDDDETGAPGLTNRSVNVFQPPSGFYQVAITGVRLGTYALEIIPFRVDGSAEPRFFVPGIAAPGSISTFQTQYSSTSGSSSTVVRTATFQSTLADISNALQLGLIDETGIATALSSKLEAAETALARGQSKTARNILAAFKNQVGAQATKHITGVVPQILLEDADSLISKVLS
jgi:hypothetical protein